MRYILLALLLLSGPLTRAQTAAPALPPPPAPLTKAALKQPIPPDPAVRTGQLSNGLRYYIRRNVVPPHRAELRLVVRAGSLLETDQQQGLAHFIEHMEFNGTQHFPKNELISTLQSAGVRFGADLNAVTNFDQTEYMLPLPTDSARVFRQGFQILEDWAHLTSFDSVEIDKERGIILEERRTGRGASQRLRDQFLPVLLNGSRYAQRLPIGTEAVLTTFRHRQLRQFYKDWYRPDLMAVVAVGDFDVAQVEALIREKFSGLVGPPKPRPRPAYPILPHRDTKVAIVTDAEQPSTVVQVYYKCPKAPSKTLADLRTSFLYRLFNIMLGSRIRELTQQADPPFLAASSSYGSLLGNLDAFSSVAVAKDGNVEPALRAILAENARVQQFGFTASELARAKQQMQVGLNRTYAEREKLQSSSLAAQYVQNFTEAAAYPSTAFYHDFFLQEQPSLTLAEVNALAGRFIHADNRVVVITAPEKNKAQLPTVAQVLGYLNAPLPPLTAYQDNTLDTPLLARQPTGTPVVRTKEYRLMGVTEWTLQNGVRVVLKPTAYQNDQILFGALGLGGTSRYELADFPSARLAAPLVSMGGTGAYSQVQLRKLLAGKQVVVEPYMNELTQGLSGAATIQDLPTALEVIYSYFTQPRADAAVVQGFLASQRAALQNQRATPVPERVFQDTLNLLLGGRNPRRAPLQPADLDRVRLDRALAIYQERFANAGDFTFFFVGNLDTIKLRPLVEKYLGGLPATGQPGAFRDLGIRTPTGPVSKTVYQGSDDKAQVRLVYSGDLAWSPEATAQLDALAEVLELQLLEKLREEASGVYSVGVQPSYSQYPTSTYQLRISFGCAPANVEKLIAKTQEIIQELQRHGATPTDLAKYKAETLRANELKLLNNTAWLGYLEDQYFNHDAPEAILYRTKALRQVTVESTREAASRYFGPNYARFVLLPQPR